MATADEPGRSSESRPATSRVSRGIIAWSGAFFWGFVIMSFPRTLGELRRSPFSESILRTRRVKDELRDNLMARLREDGPIFPGIVGYDDTVVPQVINAILSRHHFILLGLRGQAKSRMLRALTTLLDPAMPYLAGCEIHDNPYTPICRSAAAGELVAECGDAAAIAYLTPEERCYVEKLATPDVTIADLIGDLDPIKAARGGHDFSSEFTVHYGLLPRSNRGIFAINELPDLAGKIQVGLFNIMQEGDVQIKGYPIRLPLDVALVFSANPEDYYRPRENHYAAERPRGIGDSHALSRDRRGRNRHYGAGSLDRAATPRQAALAEIRVREVVERIAFMAREDKKIGQALGREPALAHLLRGERGLECRASGAIQHEEKLVVPRIGDVYAARCRPSRESSSSSMRAR